VSARVPPFYASVRKIIVRDPLAEFLGAAEGGRLEYSYLDAVKLCGHSCPTVAAAYLAVLEGLDRLYGGAIPERGGVRVELREALEDGTTGVLANVAGLITGAAADGGFKGIAGRFVRRGLLVFGAPIGADLRAAPPMTGELSAALRRALLPQATPEDAAAFAAGWQERVEGLLV
jgi:hypothetical protein